MATKQKPKAGHGAGAAAHRRRIFVEAYMRNGMNQSKAAEEAGFSTATAPYAGRDMMKEPEVQRLIAKRSERVAQLAEMKTEAWAREVCRLASSSIGDLIDEDGALLPIQHLPPEVQAAIASVDVAPDGTVKYKFWDKNAALQTMARHLGLFEKDNRQQPNVVVRVELV